MAEPAMASTGDGRVMVGFSRNDSGYAAIRAVMVTP